MQNKKIKQTLGQVDKKKSFAKGLLQWNRKSNRRLMPWKGETDPYKIWISEIILQQTRVDQGLKYYERFIQHFPTVHHLSNAPEQEVFKLWEGLGYYSRCKNLIASARYISKELNGVFPNDYPSILALKGVGPYTAAAIASFAFNLPYAVLDGNVFRVLARIFDVETPIDTTIGKQQFSELAQAAMPVKRPAAYNQAIMDFGATICKPVPECAICFFKDQCEAYLQGKQLALPIKSKKVSVRNRCFNYVVLQLQNKYACRQRTGKDIWENLWEFVLIETEKPVSKKNILLQFEKAYGVNEFKYQGEHKPVQFHQRLSHQFINFSFIKVEVTSAPYLDEQFSWLSLSEMKRYPFPKTMQQYIQSELSASIT